MTANDTGADPAALAEAWFVDLFNRGDLEVAAEILAPDVTYHGPESLSPQDVSGPDDIKEYVEVYRTAFPDLVYTVDSLDARGDTVRAHWTVTGTHEGGLFDMEPSGEMFSVSGINVFVVEDGRITDVFAQWDTLKMTQELGVVPSVGLAEA